MCVKMKVNLSMVLPWPTWSAASWAKPSSGINCSTKMTKPMAEMKPRRNGFESTLSRKPRRKSPDSKIVAPAVPAMMPQILACMTASSSVPRPRSTLPLTTLPTSNDPGASGPRII